MATIRHDITARGGGQAAKIGIADISRRNAKTAFAASTKQGE
ncbi:MAG: hypothetical protein V9G24_20910 [Rhodoblastus sp.]